MKIKKLILNFILIISFIITITAQTDKINEAKSLLKKFLKPGANYISLTNELKPSEKDYKAYFIDESWESAMKNYKDLWEKYPGFIKPNRGQSEILIWKATSDEIRNVTGDSKYFPGGYKRASKHIRPGITIYRFKFVKPGEPYGMAFDGLTFINDRWVIFPKPWRVLK